MSNSLDSFLTRIGDVTIERVTPRSGPKPNETVISNETATNTNMNSVEPQTANDESSEDSSGETSDGEQEKKNDPMQSEEIEEIHSEGSGDDMDLDETIDSQIGVRVESERQQHHSLHEEDDEEPVNILDTLPLEGAPIEGQEVTEADLLGKPILKDSDDEESIDNESDKPESHSPGEDGSDSSKRHADSDHSDPTKKKQKKEDGSEGPISECETKAEKKLSNMRRNIREVMDETQLDEATLSAQRQEMERLRRVQEQQRIIREVQRQIAINRQNNKAQTRVISLLQGKQNQGGTTISQSPSGPSGSSSTQVRLPSTVLLKVNSGSGPGSGQSPSNVQVTQTQRRPMEGMRWQKGRGVYQSAQTSISRVPNRSTGPNLLQQRIRMMTPSVSISPVVPKKEPIDRAEYFSDSEISDLEAEETLREKQMLAARKVSTGPRSQKQPKGKDVVTISSSSESSDDDCIVLSDPSGGEETDNEDDPSNSGMHTNDRYNIPDEHGRVLINVGHPDTEPDVFLAPQVARIIKPHQIGGIRFLYDNIVESIERYRSSSGFGCILAHSMGLGKTLQVASFCDIFFRSTTAKTVLCIMPINTLQNWLAEFNMWLPYEDPNAPEKICKTIGVKIEPGLEPKQEIKEESGTQSDISNMSNVSNMSRPISTESAHRFPQENTSQSMNIMSENPYGHQGYENHSMMPNYMPDNMLNKTMTDPQLHMNQNYVGDMSQTSLYNANPSHIPHFDPMKTDGNCQTVPPRQNVSEPKFGMENPNPGNVYPGMENRQHPPLYPGMENRNPSMDNRNQGLYTNTDIHHPPAMYPSYDNSTSTYPGYPLNPSVQNLNQDPKKSVGSPPQNPEASVKKEVADTIKKEEGTCTTKEEGVTEEKKDVQKVKTPYSVDSPVGMDVRPRHFRLHILNDSHKTMTARAKVIHEWQNSGGVLLIGYELYRQLSLKKPNKAKRKRGQPFKDTVDVEEEDKNKSLLDEMHGALVNPGPDLVICDEGHRIKNSHASISMALKQMRTKRRIVLTGYPLQNNLLEYWCMVDFVRPNYLGSKSEFCNMFERPIQNGQCIDSTPQDIRLMRYRAHVLHALLEGFVQRRSHSVLQVSLPRKEEYILLVRMTPHQRKLYDIFMNQVVKTRAVPNPLKAFAVCCKIWNHPDLLYHFLRKRQANEEDDLDLEETISEKATPGGKRTKARQAKGETKKGKKGAATVKNKPAASVQPNATSSASTATDSAEAENPQNPPKQTNYSNYSMPASNSTYTNPVPQSSYPQNYQNFRPNDQNAYYRNENNHTEYNEFYNNQNQQRYGNQPNFPSYTQTPGFSQAQNYPNQSQNYMSSNEQQGNNSHRYPPGPPSSDFRPDQNQTNNYESSVMYPRQNYPYQDQARNYTSNMNQGPSNYPQVSSQSSYQSQMPNQTMPDYSSYGPSTQTQNYNPTASQTNTMYTRNDNQTLQNPTLGYGNNQQSQNSTAQSQATGYVPTQQNQNPTSVQNRGFSPNQPNQNVALQNSPHAYNNSQTQNMPMQNQPHSYTSQVNSNSSNQAPLGFGQQPPNSMPQSQNHNYMTNTSQSQTPIPHSQMRGYPTSSQNQMTVQQNAGTYPPGQPAATSSTPSQAHNYSQDQQAQSTNTQNSMHGYSHLMPSSTAQTQSTYPTAQQTQAVPSSAPNHGYGNNHTGVAPMTQTSTHRYGIPQQGPVSAASSQPLAYTSNQQSSVQSMAQSDQMYPRSDSQAQTQNYAPASNTPHEFPVDRTGPGSSTTNPSNNYAANQNQTQTPMMSNYSTDTAHPNQTGQIKGSDDPYWQRNYSQQFRTDQCSDPYYRDVTPSANSNANPNVNPNMNPNASSSMNQGVSSNVNPNANSGINSNQPGNTNSSHNVNANVNAAVNPNVNPSVNRYQTNYYPQQGYANQSYDYAGSHNSDMNSRTEETKTTQANIHMQNAPVSDKNAKDMTSNVGVQSQSMHQNNLPNNPNFASDPNCQTSSRPGQSLPTSHSPRLNQSELTKEDERDKEDSIEKDKDEKSDDEVLTKDEEKDFKSSPSGKEDPGIPYDWATELMKGYVPGLIDASAKMTLFFCILEEAIQLGDRVLAFSQSLFTLNLIEDFLARNSLKYADGQTEPWIKNVNYYRLDGSTTALEREKLINEFNSNPKIHLFLVSTRAGSLGINLVGANRAIVFDASWNPCHDTQAVCRVYRYGQQKPCFVYRLVTDNCLERKIYDRQISKQGMADRVVDQCNPDAHLSLKEATTLSWDWEEDSQVQDFSQTKDSYSDEIMHRVLERHSSLLTKQPFHHESLLVDRKDKKLSQAEKRLARRGYELEKMAANCSRPSYNYVPGNTATRAGGLQIRAIRGGDTGPTPKPVASVRPMQQRGAEGLGSRNVTGSRWIPAEVWQRQGMSAQEMTLPLDVVIPTNSPDKGSIVLKAGQRVMVLKSPKGIYMQLESGKIIAIRTALKLNQQKREEEPKKGVSSVMQRNVKPDVSFPLRNNSAISIIPKSSSSNQPNNRATNKPGSGSNYRPFADKEASKRPKPVATATAKPYLSQVNLTNQVSLSRLPKVKQEAMDQSAIGDNSNSSDSQLRTEQRVEEVRLEDVVAEVSSNADYSPTNANRTPNTETDTSLQQTSEEGTQVYTSDAVTAAQSVQTQHEQKDAESPIKADKQRSPIAEKEVVKSTDSGSYKNAFQPQQEKREISNDDIIIEDPPQVSSQGQPPIQQTVSPSTLPAMVTPHSTSTNIQTKSTPPSVRTQDVQKSMPESSSVSSSTASIGTGTNTVTSPKSVESNSRETTMQGEPPNVPQGYPYAQYPRYYDYSDPRSRSLSNPYGTYFPSVPSHTPNPRVAGDPTKPQTELGKSVEDRAMMNVPTAYSQVPNTTAKTLTSTTECKAVETTVTTTTASAPVRDDAHIPTAFTHPTSSRYPGPYPPGPYDPYSQHYPPASASPAAYPPGGAPAYPAYGGPTYNTEYARMYSAFHGPPPPADPYIHRGYAPASSHPPNYYPPFPHPPPPYPNYSFLSPYPNPSMPSDPQPPAQ